MSGVSPSVISQINVQTLWSVGIHPKRGFKEVRVHHKKSYQIKIHLFIDVLKVGILAGLLTDHWVIIYGGHQKDINFFRFTQVLPGRNGP